MLPAGSATWRSTPGKTYAVEASPTVVPAQFTPVPGLEAVPASDIITTARDPRATSGAQFYRIVELP